MPGAIPQIHWGPGFSNVLDFDYPRLLDSPRTWRRPAPGSERVRNAAGTTDAWITGYDFLLAGQARYMRTSDWGGPGGLQAFLDWAAQGNTFRFVPDKNVPGFYISDCVLDEPFEDAAPALETSMFAQTAEIRIRNRQVDFAVAAIRGLMFDYMPGASLTDPIVASFTRATVRSYHTASQFIGSVPAGMLRDAHYHLGFRGTLIEPIRTNTWIRSDNFADAAWVKTNCTFVAPNVPGPDGLPSSASSMTESTDGAPTTHFFAQTLPSISDNNNQSASIYCRAGQRQWLLIQAQTKAGAAVEASFNLATGAIGTVTGGGSAYIEGPFHGAFGAYFYRCILVWNAGTGGTTPYVRFYSATGDGQAAATYQGTGVQPLSFYGAQFEPQTNYPSGYIPTVAATVQHNADTLYWPFTWPRQPMFVYVQWIEQYADNSDTRLLTFGSGSFSGVYLSLQYISGGMRAIHDVTGSNFLATSLITAPAQNAFMEALFYVTATGKVHLRLSTNGAADVVATPSGDGPVDPYYIPFTEQRFWLRTGNGPIVQRGFFRRIKVGPYNFGGQNIDTIAKARLL